MWRLLMNVRELKEILAQFDDETLVVMSKDEEGNGYSPAADYCSGYYEPESTWSGHFYPHPNKYPDHYEVMGANEEGDPENGWEYLRGRNTQFCLLLWPTN
jgi:hypothetical protein